MGGAKIHLPPQKYKASSMDQSELKMELPKISLKPKQHKLLEILNREMLRKFVFPDNYAVQKPDDNSRSNEFFNSSGLLLDI